MNESITHCTTRKLSSNVYEITISGTTRQSVHDFFEQMKAVYDETVASDSLPVHLIVIAPPEGPLPVIPLTAELKSWTPVYGKIASRCVIMYEGMFAAMVDVLTRNFGNRTAAMRIFSPKRREEALKWLMADMPGSSRLPQ